MRIEIEYYCFLCELWAWRKVGELGLSVSKLLFTNEMDELEWDKVIDRKMNVFFVVGSVDLYSSKICCKICIR